MFLEVKDLCKRYSNSNDLVLKKLNLTIMEGEVLGLLGVNGSGKTTLSSIVATLLNPTSGDILFQNKSIYSDINFFRKHLGYCPQKPNLNLLLTVEENLWFDAMYFGFSETEAKKKLEYLISSLHLEKYRNFNVGHLSGGYQQRVMIARALMHDASFIILDEPTVGLDPQSRRDLWQIIKNMKKTVLLTSHYLDEIDYLSDRVCLLEKGEIVLIDTPKNLKEKHNDSNLENIFVKLTEEKSTGEI